MSENDQVADFNTPAKPKILVIDDEQNIVTVVKARLEASGYEVLTAFDGIEGLEKVQEDCPDLILLDIMMPRMDGCEFLNQMKKLGLINKIPVIVLTAKANMREFFLINGVVDCIVKPFQSKNLLDEIKFSLSRSRPEGD